MKTISFSQYSNWLQCPLKYKLESIDKIKPPDTGIHLLFGTAVHEVIQYWLDVVYNKSVRMSDELNLAEMFKVSFTKEITKAKKKLSESNIDINLFLSPKELTEFYIDGITIIEYVRKNRTDIFPSTKWWKLKGCEIRLDYTVTPGTRFQGYIDVLFEHKKTKEHLIIDFKTSTRAWSDFQKKDKSKTAQLLLYKKILSEKHNIPIELIESSFIVLKRKVSTHMDFPEKRTTNITPAQSKRTVDSTWNEFVNWANTIWDETGKVREDVEFPAKENGLCKYCSFFETSHCPVTLNKKNTDKTI